jgi:hypothetical protein
MGEYYDNELTEPTFTDVLKDIIETGGILAWSVLLMFIAVIIFSIIVIVTIIKDSRKKE